MKALALALALALAAVAASAHDRAREEIKGQVLAEEAKRTPQVMVCGSELQHLEQICVRWVCDNYCSTDREKFHFAVCMGRVPYAD